MYSSHATDQNRGYLYICRLKFLIVRVTAEIGFGSKGSKSLNNVIFFSPLFFFLGWCAANDPFGCAVLARDHLQTGRRKFNIKQNRKKESKKPNGSRFRRESLN